ncbi:MAG TPA: hypothetical protein VKS22_08280 [Candidatus Binataceae bacterium]|nr:hypothetical protein [Candidatus Binataceae bacterium]
MHDTHDTSESLEPLERDTRIASALLEIARIRYEAFRERFGREPKPDDPLLFDPREDEPVPANVTDQVLQVVSAAMLSNVDADMVLGYLGFNYVH